MGEIKNILILSASHPYKTAGIAAYNIFKGLKLKGYKVKLIVKIYDKYEPGIISMDTFISLLFKKIKNKLIKFINKPTKTNPIYSIQNLIQTKEFYKTKKILRKFKDKPDVIIIVFPQNFLIFKNIYELYKRTKAKIFWQMADMSPLTGGCHYSWECDGYKFECVNCPAVNNNLDRKHINDNFIDKLKNISDIPITCVAGSDWLISKIKESALFKNKKIKKIYLAQNINEFTPISIQEKIKKRKKLNIPYNNAIILIGANYLDGKRKGIELILSALKILKYKHKIKNINLVIAGNNLNSIKDKIVYNYTYLGGLTRDELKMIYQISDVFISASLQDVGPYMLTEALLSGIPVISFNTGFANEFIINKRTGYLCAEATSAEIVKGFLWFNDLDIKELYKIKEAAITKVREKINIEVINDKWENLINN